MREGESDSILPIGIYMSEKRGSVGRYTSKNVRIIQAHESKGRRKTFMMLMSGLLSRDHEMV
jgi:hypothetical protein